MIDFRYHVVSIIAVFLALALGLVLGSTTLQGTVTHNLSKQAARVTAENRADERKIDDLEASLSNEEAFTAATESHVVA
ncbi:MAG TPA: copper transporter, partial [Mycobacteriales bacterium]|nr:copper transporter [Mycobacteriales bacterium]